MQRAAVAAGKRVTSSRSNAERVVRIIDASAELLLQRGYRRVTVEEVASHAGVSKSSVYLHWNTKDDIFYDALDRECAALVCEAVDRVRRNPAEILAHRMAANLLRIILDRPLLRALLMGDQAILGSLRHAKSSALRSRTAAIDELIHRYLSALQKNQLICPDIDLRITRKAVWEMLRGMIFSAGTEPLGKPRSAELAQVMTVTVRRAFEPRGVPGIDRITAAAAEVFEAFDELIPTAENLDFERPMVL
ncbi:TetR/AcrR family transcriptional regulator [Planobispora rosea]|uniref:TetR/AcrR family transcriptional regulator n=1 Tax=Planobispora rosea TaxID=35762 RepID=UPI0027DCEAC9|nr:helix-turn-helix domain-containing protein [Planobispora rosea]